MSILGEYAYYIEEAAMINEALQDLAQAMGFADTDAYLTALEWEGARILERLRKPLDNV